MSKLLPYEEKWLSMQADLRLPDEDMAWADMKQRLEGKKRRRFIWWHWGCLGLGVFLGILLAGGIIWLTIRKKTEEPVHANEQPISKKLLPDSTIIIKSHTCDKAVNSDVILTDTVYNYTDTIIPGLAKTKGRMPDQAAKPMRDLSSRVKDIITIPAVKQKVKRNGSNRNKDSNDNERDNAIIETKKENEKFISPIPPSADSANSNPILPPADTTAIIKPARNKLGNDSAQTAKKEDSRVHKPAQKIYFSAGIGLQQLIPLQGQQLTPYNASGRKGSIGDYIPSLFLKVHKGEKWFLQAEFRYGAPQTTKSFVYKETNVPDTGTAPAFNMVSSSQLRKTFYHQLPVTLHYLFNKQFSIGLGMQVNRFQAAISEQSVVKHDNITLADTLVSKTTLAEKNAAQSGFAATYLLGVGELQYQWRRFFIGVKYTYGLQPYIRFTIEGQGEQKESSRSLQIMLRYQIWKSKQGR